MILIKGGRVIDPASGRDEICDILINGNKIKSVDKIIFENDNVIDQVIDAQGMIVAPGLVDVHVHFRDPGFEYKEDIYTGAKAAAAGGFTTVVMMANTKPVIDNTDTLSYVLNKGKETDINVVSCGTITKGLKGKELTDMDGLLSAGAVGFTDDGIPIMDEEVVIAAMKKAVELDVPLSFHEENPQFITNNGVNRGKASEYYNIEGSPKAAEIDMIHRDLELAKKIGASIDIQHISTGEGVELVRAAKEETKNRVGGSNIHAEATPHHFSLTEDAVIKHGTLAKMNPPLRTEADRLAIINGLKDNTIDLIATDHAPHSSEEKSKPITEAPSGIIGLETSLALGITNLVKPGHLTYNELLEKMTINPAKLYHLDCGYIGEGGPADLVIFSEDEYVVGNHFNSKSVNTPFIGEKLCGKIKYTICGGRVIYNN